VELPPALRAGVEALLADTPVARLAEAGAVLSQRYRAEVRDGRAHLADDLAARAYLATRMPATFAAIAKSMQAVAQALPDFTPASLLDVGAGPGTAMWAACETWPGLVGAQLVERAGAIRSLGQVLGAPAGVAAGWLDLDLASAAPEHQADLVSAAYLLNEIAEARRGALIDALWQRTLGVLLLVEPGTPAGWERLLAAREQLIGAGGHVAAPCAHAQACPLTAPDFCRFAARVSRSRLHRLVKGGELGWEDEPFVYLAVSRQPPAGNGSRLLAEPRAGKGRIELKLCSPDGTLQRRLVTRREPDDWRVARRLDWGDQGL
jgi:ribosomal protein RSM22 (predicted rRNA methylase)